MTDTTTADALRLAKEANEAFERIARALWIANGNRDDLWDGEPNNARDTLFVVRQIAREALAALTPTTGQSPTPISEETAKASPEGGR